MDSTTTGLDYWIGLLNWSTGLHQRGSALSSGASHPIEETKAMQVFHIYISIEHLSGTMLANNPVLDYSSSEP